MIRLIIIVIQMRSNYIAKAFGVERAGSRLMDNQ